MYCIIYLFIFLQLKYIYRHQVNLSCFQSEVDIYVYCLLLEKKGQVSSFIFPF